MQSFRPDPATVVGAAFIDGGRSRGEARPGSACSSARDAVPGRMSIRPVAPVPHVVIVGGGFGGLETAKGLANSPLRVTLVDRSNHHLFQPLLYQVATAGLSPAEIAIPVRSVLRSAANVGVVMASVVHIDLEQRRLELDDGSELRFDHLVIAAGARASYFGNDDWEAFATPLKSVEDALRIRRNVLLAFERADRLSEPAHRRRELTFVVIGGGPTGVELAGSLSELTKRVLASDFRRVCPTEPHVILLEGADRLLTGMSPDSSQVALDALKAMGIEVRLGALARKIDERGVHLDHEIIEADTIVWAAGVSANSLAGALGVEVDRGGRIIVNQDCTVPGYSDVYAIGDIANFRTEKGSLPGVSPVAMQQGRYVAASILRRSRGQPVDAFEYRDKGTMATIGRSRAVAEIGRFHLRGFPAWLAWLFVHLWFLVGFKNRVFVLLQWVFSYVFYRRGSRLITHTDHKAEALRRSRRLKETLGADALRRQPGSAAEDAA